MYDIPISYAGPSRAEPVSGSYQSAPSVQMIGCTCGGIGPCRATCRTPLH